MAYDTHLQERIDRIFANRKLEYRHLKMMGGLCYMFDEKMCCGIVKKQLMARVGPDNYEVCLAKDGCSEMNFSGRGLKGYVFVDEDALDMDSELEFYIDLCIAHNPDAKRSKKKAKNSISASILFIVHPSILVSYLDELRMTITYLDAILSV